jgi:diguanylate cyclase (GGDEF)-like protein
VTLRQIESELARLDANRLPQLYTAVDRLRRRVAQGDRGLEVEAKALLATVLEAAARTEQTLAVQRARIRHLESLSITDELTGLLNRRGFRRELDRALARARRNRESGVLLLCDLDHFKAINDSYGHPAGDAVICAVADLLHGQTRRSDYVARLGGDEFAVLMTYGSRGQADRRMAHLAKAVNSLVVRWGDHRIPVTASFGSEAYHWGSEADALLFQADRALYRRKGPRVVALRPLRKGR